MQVTQTIALNESDFKKAAKRGVSVLVCKQPLKKIRGNLVIAGNLGVVQLKNLHLVEGNLIVRPGTSLIISANETKEFKGSAVNVTGGIECYGSIKVEGKNTSLAVGRFLSAGSLTVSGPASIRRDVKVENNIHISGDFSFWNLHADGSVMAASVWAQEDIYTRKDMTATAGNIFARRIIDVGANLRAQKGDIESERQFIRAGLEIAAINIRAHQDIQAGDSITADTISTNQRIFAGLDPRMPEGGSGRIVARKMTGNIGCGYHIKPATAEAA